MSSMTGTIYKIIIEVVDTDTRAVPVSVEVSYFNAQSGAPNNITMKRLGFNESLLLPAEVTPGERWEVTQAFANTPVFTDSLQAKADAAAMALYNANVYWNYYD